ncbi:hypothetical protein BKI52_39155 [marine bacterium AO1-C]|nr:hypothetical protein BKI52_39155 [marine bacterium AO1-C]
MKGSLDHWTSLFLIAAGLGFFLAILLFFAKTSTLRNRVLALLVLLFAVSLVDNVMYWSGYYQDYPHLLGLSMPFPFLYGPLLLGYVQVVLTPKTFSWKKYRWHFSHFALAFLYLTPYYFSPAQGKLRMLEHWYQNIINALILPWLGLICLIAYTIVTLRFLRKIQNKQAVTILSLKHWVGQTFFAFAIFTSLFTVYYILLYARLSSPNTDYIIAFGSTIFIYFIGYLGYSQSKVLTGLPVNTNKYQSTTLTTSASRQLYDRVKAHLETHKTFTDNDLSLSSLAQNLSLTPHQLSQVINEHAQTNFSGFINAYRIEEAKALLGEIPRINQVAYEVGFNNKTSFNLAFKKYTGLSPSEYKKKMLI